MKYVDARDRLISMMGVRNWNYLMKEVSHDEYMYAVKKWPIIKFKRQGKEYTYDVSSIINSKEVEP